MDLTLACISSCSLLCVINRCSDAKFTHMLLVFQWANFFTSYKNSPTLIAIMPKCHAHVHPEKNTLNAFKLSGGTVESSIALIVPSCWQVLLLLWWLIFLLTGKRYICLCNNATKCISTNSLNDLWGGITFKYIITVTFPGQTMITSITNSCLLSLEKTKLSSLNLSRPAVPPGVGCKKFHQSIQYKKWINKLRHSSSVINSVAYQYFLHWKWTPTLCPCQ